MCCGRPVRVNVNIRGENENEREWRRKEGERLETHKEAHAFVEIFSLPKKGNFFSGFVEEK